jgi:hypothetical protein
LDSSNDSIDFVQRFQWIRSTIPLDLSSHSAAFVASVRRFRRSFPAVLASLAVASQLAKLEFGVHLNMCSRDENEGNAMRSRSPLCSAKRRCLSGQQ